MATSQDQYAKNLQQSYGFPLRTPEPHSTLPESYHDDGLQIGDVGFVNDQGAFIVLFNICSSPSSMLHRRHGVPADFQPIDIDLEGLTGITRNAIPPECVISSPHVNRVLATQCRDPSVAYEFCPSTPIGAILILPFGAVHHDLEDKEEFRRAAISQGQAWCAFARRNDIYLITGFYKSAAWTLGSFSDAPGKRERHIQIVKRGGSMGMYGWDHTFPVDWRDGPEDQSYTRINQSVFIHGFKIAVRRWTRDPLIEAVPNSRPSFAEASRKRLANLLDGMRVTGISVEHEPQFSESFHPSDAINRFLLDKNPVAQVAITHDDEWIRMIERGELTYDTLAEEESFAKFLLEHCSDSQVFENDNGAVCLRRSIRPLINEQASHSSMDNPYSEPERAPSQLLSGMPTRTTGGLGKMALRGLASLSLSRMSTSTDDSEKEKESRGRTKTKPRSSSFVLPLSFKGTETDSLSSKWSTRTRSQSPFSLRRFRSRDRESSPAPLPLEESDSESITSWRSTAVHPRTAFTDDGESGAEYAGEEAEDDEDEWSDDVSDTFDFVTEQNTEQNAHIATTARDGSRFGDVGVDEGDAAMDPDPLGEGVNIVVPPGPYFPSNRNLSGFGSMQDKRGAARRKKHIEMFPLSTSRPLFQRDRCTITLTQGAPNASERRKRTYVVASDLSEESRYAVEWGIGTVLRDGDELLIVTVVENENKIDPPVPNPGDRATKLRSQQERQGFAYILVRQAIALLQRTRLHVTVACQAWHAKNARHMLLDIVDYNEPTMLIVGSRGRSQVKGIVLGSTSHYLIQRCSVPVMVARRRLKRPPKQSAHLAEHRVHVSLAEAGIDRVVAKVDHDVAVMRDEMQRDDERRGSKDGSRGIDEEAEVEGEGEGEETVEDGEEGEGHLGPKARG